MITQEYLKEILNYDGNSGILTWKKRGYGRRVNGIAGTIRNNGYKTIRIGEKHYQYHRIVWMYMYGEFPKYHLDHIDHNPSNNSIVNLRDVSVSLNIQNQTKAHSNNRNGFLGASLQRKGKYQARIQVNKKNISLGYYSNPEDAHKAYLNAKREFHTTCTI